jgi:hypothetical protein
MKWLLSWAMRRKRSVATWLYNARGLWRRLIFTRVVPLPSALAWKRCTRNQKG